MELGNIIPIRIPLWEQPAAPTWKPRANLTAVSNFIRDVPELYGDADKVLRDSQQKIKPKSAPWADVGQAIDSTPVHSDADSMAMLSEQARLVETYRHADLGKSTGSFSFSWLAKAAAPPSAARIAGCPANSVEFSGRCLFLRTLSCGYERLLEEKWLHMTEEERNFCADVCGL